MSTSPLATARACLQAYVNKDRAVIEALIADALDRKSYLEICWPNSKAMTGFDYIPG